MPHLSPTTLTTDEQRLILHATAGNVRDHTIISLALGTGVRLGEIVGLNVGDVFAPDGTPRVRVRIRAAIAKGGRAADVFLPDRLVVKLKRFWRCKRERGEDLSADAPLFANQSGRRISKRRVQFAWATWQRRARFDRRYGFHKDGSKIKTLYYACGGWVMKGASACEKFLIRKEPLEDLLLETIQRRLQSLLAGEGETILRGYIEDELAAQGQDPLRELATIRARIAEIDLKASVLLEGLSADTKGFVDAKLRGLGGERRRLQNRHDELEMAPYDPIDAEAVLESGLASLSRLPSLLESGSLEDRKEFVRAFVGSVSVVPGEARVDVQMHTLPAVGALRPANSTCGLVAGARYVPVQLKLTPLNRYLAGLRRAA